MVPVETVTPSAASPGFTFQRWRRTPSGATPSWNTSNGCIPAAKSWRRKRVILLCPMNCSPKCWPKPRRSAEGAQHGALCKHFWDEIEDCRRLNQHAKFIGRQSCLPQDSTQSPCIQLLVIWYHHLSERHVPAKYDVAALLSLNLKACFAKSRNTDAPRDPRQLGHTASKTASNRSGGIGKPSC